MRKIFSAAFLGGLLFAACLIVSCTSDNPVIPPEPEPEPVVGKQIIISEDNATYVNTKKIVIGLDEDDFSYKRVTTIIDQRGKVQETVRDCSAMAAIKLNGDEQAPDGKVNNVTLINRGIIEIHTKGMVNKWRDQIQTWTITDRPYHYLRVIGMLGEGDGNQLVNEGLIDVYFDHDPSEQFRVYCFAICGNDHSTFINRGEIRFQGTGGPLTRMRAMGTAGNYVTSINYGTMKVDVDMAEDTRFITTGGDYNDVINNGVMEGRTTGRLLGMTRYGNSNIVNNGTISLTTTKMKEGYTSPLTMTDRYTAGLMENMSASRENISPMTNRGTIDVTIEETESEASAGYGMFFDMVAPNQANVTINNEGTINLRQNDPVYRHRMAEAGFVDRSGKQGVNHITIGRWFTTLRDFKSTNDLFLCHGASVNFGGAEIKFRQGEGYVSGTAYSVSPEALLYNTGGADDTFEYKNYDGMTFTSGEDNLLARWDQEAMTVSLTPKESFTIDTGLDYYKGLTLQVGEAGSTVPLSQAVVDDSGCAAFTIDLTPYVGKNLWFCVPKMVKFFHTLQAAEASAMRLRLPDKDGGSTLDASGLGNDWIVALYMGINKDGSSDIPIYWATGNLIAVKTSEAGEPSEVAYHIADAAETTREGLADNGLVGLDDRLISNVPDGYVNMPAGSKWDMFGFGDKTGLMLYDMNLHKEYSIATGQMSEDRSVVYWDISGDARFDAARAQLGGLWRLPTCLDSGPNEFAAFEDGCAEYANLLPDGETYGESGVTSFGMQYRHPVVIAGREVTVNTLQFPAAGFRHANEQYGAVGVYCLYWGGNADPKGTIPYTPGGNSWAEGKTMPKWFTAFNYGWLDNMLTWFPHPRTSSEALRPVTE